MIEFSRWGGLYRAYFGQDGSVAVSRVVSRINPRTGRPDTYEKTICSTWPKARSLKAHARKLKETASD